MGIIVERDKVDLASLWVILRVSLCLVQGKVNERLRGGFITHRDKDVSINVIKYERKRKWTAMVRRLRVLWPQNHPVGFYTKNTRYVEKKLLRGLTNHSVLIGLWVLLSTIMTRHMSAPSIVLLLRSLDI